MKFDQRIRSRGSKNLCNWWAQKPSSKYGEITPLLRKNTQFCGIVTYIWRILVVNVGKYTIH